MVGARWATNPGLRASLLLGDSYEGDWADGKFQAAAGASWLEQAAKMDLRRTGASTSMRMATSLWAFGTRASN